VYLLRSYCISPTGEIQLKNFLSLANAVIAVFALSIGPFALMGQIPQLLSRLFPFTRGLNHAYWAPNVWALVTAFDRALLKCRLVTSITVFLRVLTHLITVVQFTGANIPINEAGVVSTSRGLVGDTVFAVIPDIKPIHTFAITIAFQLVRGMLLTSSLVSHSTLQVWLYKLWKNPSYKSFLTALTLSGWTSFLFGWHVHEKAVLLVLVPLRHETCNTPLFGKLINFFQPPSRRTTCLL